MDGANVFKHVDEAEDDEELREIVRDLYDFILAVGPLDEAESPTTYLKLRKKLGNSNGPPLYEGSTRSQWAHQLCMAARSLRIAVDQIEEFIASTKREPQ